MNDGEREEVTPLHFPMSHLSRAQVFTEWGALGLKQCASHANTNMTESLPAPAPYQSISLIIPSLRYSPPSVLQFSSLSSSRWPLTHFPSRYICSLKVRGHRGNQAISQPAAGAHSHEPSCSRLSDSLITRCKRTKPLCCTAVNRIRRPLVLLPSPLPLHAYFLVSAAVCVCVCVCRER